MLKAKDERLHMPDDAKDEVREAKKRWRRLAGEQFALNPCEKRRRLDAELLEQLWDVALENATGPILGYSALPDEADITDFMRRWLEEGGVLALPVWLGEAEVGLRYVDDLDRQLVKGKGGILVPDDTCPVAKGGEIQLAIAPGRCFSEDGDRLGRGAGVYDALFRKYRDMHRVGAGYDFQVYPAIPKTDADMPMHKVVTPARIIETEPI